MRMMRYSWHMARLAILISVCLACGPPAAAWQFSPDPVCRVEHATAQGDLLMTYDPRTALYRIAVTRPERWPDAAVFALRFDGPRGRTITTKRHQMSGDGRTLSVTDTGFGNVLDGLEFNRSAHAFVPDAELDFDLLGDPPAAPAVSAFRACVAAPTA